MNRRLPFELAPHALRLREIERELAYLRREQRLFRRLGFGENVKVMQIVALQVEQREHLEILRPKARSWELDVRIVAIRKVCSGVGLMGGLLAGGAFLGFQRITNRTRRPAIARGRLVSGVESSGGRRGQVFA